MSVSTSIGPISGIDYGTLITGLVGLEQKPIDDITTRLTKLDQQNTALQGLATLMTGLKVSSASFVSSAVFRAATATSANPSVASATAGAGTPNGNYSFNVQRLASASQQVTQGFANSNTALGLAGDIKLRLGGGKLNDVAKLTQLNGGAGVARGSIRVTDRSGASSLIDLSHAVDINDVVNTLNSSTGVNVLAKIDGDKLVLTDNTGGSGTLAVTNAGGTSTATDLGLTTTAVGGTLTGSSLTKLTAATTLDALNDGNGLRTSGILDDFSITGAGGTFNVSVNDARTLGDLISKINTAGQSAGITAAISADGHGLTLTDASGGPITVAALNTSLAASDLGILGTSSGATLTGARIASALTGPLLSNLNGGWNNQPGEVAPQYGTITINGQAIDLTNVRTLNDAISAVNTNSQGVTAALNNTGNGITLSSASGAFTVADGTGNLASFLNIAGTSTANATGSAINSGDLHLRCISNNTQLSTLNGGIGVKLGSIRITDGAGAALTMDLTGTDITTIGAVLNRINTSGLAISARVNDTGNGILLTQTSGAGTAKVEDIGSGTTARDLGILGTFVSGQLDGAFQKTISIIASDKLSDIATKLNNANAGIVASIINDGSGATPYRLSLVSRNAGQDGRLIFDGSAIGLNTTSLVEGQDAVAIYGGNASGTGGLQVTSSTNALSGIVPGLTLNLTGVGSTTVSVTQDPSKVSTAVQGFVDAYNKVINNIAEVTKFDPNDSTNNGVLFGDATVQNVEQALGQFVAQAYTGVGSLRTLAAVGISIGQDGTLSLNTDKLNSLLATNPDDVRSFFTTNIKAVAANPSATPPTLASSAVKGVGITLSDLLDRFTNAQTGLIFQSSDAIQTQETQLKDRQIALAALLIAKKNRLIQQFAHLEVTIAQLQSQGNALTSFTSSLTSSSSSKK
jgi:flagellar hook-associated protein 2